MKNKHKRAFTNAYKWWDYTYLLQAIHDWAEAAAKGQEHHSHHLGAHKSARQLKVVAHLCKRIIDDDYSAPFWFSHVKLNHNFGDREELDNGAGYYQVHFSYVPNEKTYKLVRDKKMKQREKDLKMLTELMNKYMFTWWD